eukprot:gene15698-17281_t
MAYLVAFWCLSFALLYHANCQSVCKDVITSCALYKSYGYCATYKTYMTANCARTCGFCSTTTPKPDSDCKDDNTNCPSWQQYCVQSSRYWPYMSKNCKKTCKICTDGSGGGGGGNGSGKKEFQCSFEGNFCNWSNQHIDDAADWAVGTVAGGPSSGANGTSSYAYVNTGNSGYNARLVLPWELVLPIGTTNVGTMCLNFRYQTGNGNLKFIEDKYPDLNNKIPSPINKGTLSGSGSWVYGKVQVYVDNERALVIEGTPGSSGKVVIDELFFVKGSSACSDVVSYCAFYQQYNYCQLYPDYMKTYCAKTCGFCSIAPTTRPQPTTQQPIPTGPAQKEFQCSFEGDFCNWNNEHIGDAADWAVGTVAGGPSSGADGTHVEDLIKTRDAMPPIK